MGVHRRVGLCASVNFYVSVHVSVMISVSEWVRERVSGCV